MSQAELTYWDYLPCPPTETAETYYDAQGRLTEAGEGWVKGQQGLIRALFRQHCRAAVTAAFWPTVWGGLFSWGAFALSPGFGLIVAALSIALIARGVYKRLGEAGLARAQGEQAQDCAEASLSQWAVLSEEERSSVRSRKRMLLKKNIALGVAAAPFLIVGGALQMLGLGGVIDLLGG